MSTVVVTETIWPTKPKIFTIWSFTEKKKATLNCLAAFCLASLHVDILPGDRANPCGGIMLPYRAEPDPKKGYVLYHRCTKCGAVGRNKAAHEAPTQPDDLDLIIALTAGEYRPKK